MIFRSNGEYVLLSEKEKLLVLENVRESIPRDRLMAAIHALEAGLMASGYEFELGVGVSAAQRSLT